MNQPDFISESYERHSKEWNERAAGGKEEEIKPWFLSDEQSRWRYERIYQMIDPLLENFPSAKWFTIGDGFYGGDAFYLQNKGADVVATNLSDILLKESHARGFIKNFSQQNAEALTFGNSSFDFCLCKESYHHFPRPMLALYEALRVSRLGVVLIEPVDYMINSSFLERSFRFLKDSLKKLFKRQVWGEAEYEEVGNFVFALSKREIEKVALGLNYSCVAFHSINDFYLPTDSADKASSEKIFSKVKNRVRFNDWLDRLGLQRKGLMVSILFKIDPAENLRKQLQNAGYTVRSLPRNPYISPAPTARTLP